MFTEDLTVFLDTAGFAVTATAGASSFPVVFDAPSAQAAGDMVVVSQPQAIARTVDVAALTWGSSITINGSTYSVVSNLPDGTGMSTLVLSNA